MKWKFFTLAVFSFLSSTFLISQTDTIYLTNPSFEDVIARMGRPPHDWANADCGFPTESEPDTHPGGHFDVVKPAFDGNTYLGMVVRDDETWEAVSQRMSQALKSGQCYEFTIMLARSELYISLSQAYQEQANYTTPAVLKIYGGYDYCDKKEVLGKTKEIINHRWVEYRFKFEPTENFTFITLEAFYRTPTLFPYNGNILLDKASAITPIPCDESLVIEETTPPVVFPPINSPAVSPNNKPPVIEEKGPVYEGVTIKKDQIIPLNQVFFETNTANLKGESLKELEQMYQFMVVNPDVYIEIAGYASKLADHDFADKISTARAKSVRDYLIQRGIDHGRVGYIGYGKRRQIISNDPEEMKRQNQRVEIKVLKING